MPERKIREDWAGLETSAYNKLRRKPIDLWPLNLSRYSLGLETRGQGPPTCSCYSLLGHDK